MTPLRCDLWCNFPLSLLPRRTPRGLKGVKGLEDLGNGMENGKDLMDLTDLTDWKALAWTGLKVPEGPSQTAWRSGGGRTGKACLVWPQGGTLR